HALTCKLQQRRVVRDPSPSTKSAAGGNDGTGRRLAGPETLGRANWQSLRRSIYQSGRSRPFSAVPINVIRHRSITLPKPNRHTAPLRYGRELVRGPATRRAVNAFRSTDT